MTVTAQWNVGDVFQVPGKYAVNPITGKATEHLEYFAVTDVIDGVALRHGVPVPPDAEPVLWQGDSFDGRG